MKASVLNNPCDQCGAKKGVHYQGVCSSCHAKGYKKGDSYTPLWVRAIGWLLVAGIFLFLGFALLMSIGGFYTDARIWAGLGMGCFVLLGGVVSIKSKRPSGN
jgi:hypothetical protein